MTVSVFFSYSLLILGLYCYKVSFAAINTTVTTDKGVGVKEIRLYVSGEIITVMENQPLEVMFQSDSLISSASCRKKKPNELVFTYCNGKKSICTDVIGSQANEGKWLCNITESIADKFFHTIVQLVIQVKENNINISIVRGPSSEYEHYVSGGVIYLLGEEKIQLLFESISPIQNAICTNQDSNVTNVLDTKYKNTQLRHSITASNDTDGRWFCEFEDVFCSVITRKLLISVKYLRIIINDAKVNITREKPESNYYFIAGDRIKLTCYSSPVLHGGDDTTLTLKLCLKNYVHCSESISYFKNVVSINHRIFTELNDGDILECILARNRHFNYTTKTTFILKSHGFISTTDQSFAKSFNWTTNRSTSTTEHSAMLYQSTIDSRNGTKDSPIHVNSTSSTNALIVSGEEKRQVYCYKYNAQWLYIIIGCMAAVILICVSVITILCICLKKKMKPETNLVARQDITERVYYTIAENDTYSYVTPEYVK